MLGFREVSGSHAVPLFMLLAPLLCAAWPFGRKGSDDASEDDATSDAPDQVSGDPVDYLDWGLRLATLGKTERAADRFKHAVERNPNDATALYNLGLALDQLGQHSDAVTHLRLAAQLAPDSLEVRVNLGSALLADLDAAGAVSEFQAALDIASDDHSANFGLACALLAAGDYREAVASFRRAVKSDPSDPEVRFNLAIALRKADCPDLAEMELQEFLRLAGDRYPEQSAYAERLLSEPTEEQGNA